MDVASAVAERGQARPCCFSHVWATEAGDSFWGPVTSKFSLEIWAVVSLADRALSASATPAESADADVACSASSFVTSASPSAGC